MSTAKTKAAIEAENFYRKQYQLHKKKALDYVRIFHSDGGYVKKVRYDRENEGVRSLVSAIIEEEGFEILTAKRLLREKFYLLGIFERWFFGHPFYVRREYEVYYLNNPLKDVQGTETYKAGILRAHREAEAALNAASDSDEDDSESDEDEDE